MSPVEPPAAPPLPRWRELLWIPLVLLGTVWVLVVPQLGQRAWASTWHFYGEPPSPAELAAQQRGFAVACAVSLTIAVLGFALAVAARSTVAGFVFALLLVPTTVLGLLWLGSWQSQQPHSAPSSRTYGHCQEFSGSDNRCPGG